MRKRKPDPRTAMRQLLAQARGLLGRVHFADLECDGDCGDCMIRSVEVFEQALADWDLRLAQGVHPTLSDLEDMAQFGWALARSLVRAGLLTEADLPAKPDVSNGADPS